MSGKIKNLVKAGVAGMALTVLLSGCVSVGTDKAIHFSAAGFISMMATCLAPQNVAIATGAATGIGAGLAKEAYDSRAGGSEFSGEDLLADGLGAGVGTALGYTLCHAQNPR